jgi:hypothetical protein
MNKKKSVTDEKQNQLRKACMAALADPNADLIEVAQELGWDKMQDAEDWTEQAGYSDEIEIASALGWDDSDVARQWLDQNVGDSVDIAEELGWSVEDAAEEWLEGHANE